MTAGGGDDVMPGLREGRAERGAHAAGPDDAHGEPGGAGGRVTGARQVGGQVEGIVGHLTSVPVLGGTGRSGPWYGVRRPTCPRALVVPGAHQSGLVRKDDGLDAVAQAELGEDTADVRLHRRLGEGQQLGDLAVG